jgi:CDP-diacylglycerol---glycerol-3-phosphate 3-phosphatidyltransferase
MISVYNIKPKFQQLLRPVLRVLYNMGVSANMITWASILLSVATGLMVWFHPYGSSLWLLPLFLFIRMALNALDGMMAREYNMQSRGGEILNELGDIVSDVFIFFPLSKLFSINGGVLYVFIFLSIINECAGILAKAITGVRRYEGPMGKSDRAFLVGLTSLVLYFTETVREYLNIVFLIAIALLIISTSTRIYKTLKH